MKSKGKSLKGHPNFKGNKWEEKEDCFIGIDAKGNRFKISKEDYEECSKYCWTGKDESSRNPKNGLYFSARMSRKSPEGHKMKMLHNFVWEKHNGKIPEGYLVDHIDRFPENNCINNLRLVDKSLNSLNSDIRKNNSSGVTGVSFYEKRQCWRAFINYGGKRYELGRRKNKEEAIKLRLKAELEYLGGFAPQRHLFEQYGIEAEDGN